MEIIIIILSILLITVSVGSYILYNKLRDKLINIINDKLLSLTLRTGFYEYPVHLLKSNNNSEYDVYLSIFYVTELERYNNGYSKIRLDKINIISGVSVGEYDWVKKCVKERFKEVVLTTDITWLEKDKDLTEVRKDKLERILKEE